MQALLGGQAWLALEVERTLSRVPFGAHEELGKCGVGFVGARVGHRHLERRHQVELELVVAEVAQLDLAQLDVVFRAHPHRAPGVQVAPLRIEADAVDVEGGLVVRSSVRRRVLGDGNERGRWLRHSRPETRSEQGRRSHRAAAQVEERAMRIAQRVVAPARNERIAEAAPARAVGTQRHAVAAVREQVRRLQCRRAGHHLAPQAGADLAAVGTARPGRCFEQHRHLARHPLLQQRRHGLQARLGHRPTAWRGVEQHVGQRQDRHALVVRHEGVDRGERGLGGDALGRVVERLDEARSAARMQCFQAPQVGRCGRRVDERGQRRGIRGHHQFVGRRAAQRQHGHALRCVLVGQRVVARGIGRFRDAPRHLPHLGERLLRFQRSPRGARQHAGIGLVEQQRRHQVLEHRARPRTQPGGAAIGKERPAERAPVHHRHVAFGDGPQAGDARLGRQQVVVAGVELLLGHPKADVEELAPPVVEKAEVRLVGQAAAVAGQRAQPLRQRRLSVRGAGRHVERQRTQGADVVAHALRREHRR